MRTELIFIGDELLTGAVVNSNAAYLGQKLSGMGLKVARHTAIADEPHAISQGLTEAVLRSDLVLMTGGLGPTLDDRTREVLATLFDTSLELNEQVFSELKKRYGQMQLSLKNQATIPKSAKALINPNGTAPGLILEKKGKVLIALPGVPLEMKALFEGEVLPFLKERYREETAFFSENLTFFCLSESALDPVLRKLARPDVEMGIYPSYGVLRVVLTSKNLSEIHALKKEIIAAFKENHFSSPSNTLEEAIQMELLSQGKKLAIAESCTGGRIAAALTSIAGSSGYLLGSLVTYSHAFKESLLGVAPSTLEKKGDVSSETVLEMLEGLFAKTGADYGLAVTGVAGPGGGSAALPVGTFFIAAGARGQKPLFERHYFPGNREKIQLIATSFALGLLFRCVQR